MRDLFTFHSQTSCHTHELLGCLCAYDNETKEIDREDDQVGSDEAPTDSDCENNDDIVSQQHMGFQKASLYSTKNLTKLERDVRGFYYYLTMFIFLTVSVCEKQKGRIGFTR